MAEFSARFRLALHHTLILFAAGLTAIFLWVYLRLPQGNLLLVVFAFLSAVRIADFSSRQMRLQILLGMLFSTAVLQYIVSATNNIQLLNIFIPAAANSAALRSKSRSLHSKSSGSLYQKTPNLSCTEKLFFIKIFINEVMLKQRFFLRLLRITRQKANKKAVFTPPFQIQTTYYSSEKSSNTILPYLPPLEACSST